MTIRNVMIVDSKCLHFVFLQGMSMPMSPSDPAAAAMNKPGSPYYPYPNRKRPVDEALQGK